MDRPLRIAHYYPRAVVGDGGCTTSVRGWAAGLASVGVDVVVAYDAVDARQGWSEGRVEWRPIQHRRLGSLKSPAGIGPVLADIDVLVLHSGWVYHNLRAAAWARNTGIPYVVTPHGAYDPNVLRRRAAIKSAWWRVGERHLLDRALAVHLFFDAERENLARLRYRGRVMIAPNGVDVPPIASEQQRAPYALWMGRFDVETKGIDLLLRAQASLPHERRVDLRLHGPDWRNGKQRTLQLIRDLDLGDSVRVGPAVYGVEKWSLLRECGVFLFTSRWDSSSMMVLEAAGAGAPIVATSTTSLGRELAASGAAILVEPTPAGIATGMLTGASQQGRLIGCRAAAVVGMEFTWPAVAVRLLDQLQPLL